MEDKILGYKFLRSVYLLVLILYSLFFLLFVAITIAPNNYLTYVLFYVIINGLFYFYAYLLIPLGIVMYLFIFYLLENRPHERKQLRKVVLIMLVIIGIFILIFFLLRWMVPTYWIIFRAYGID